MAAALLWLQACTVSLPEPTTYSALATQAAPVDENQLLDVGIVLFGTVQQEFTEQELEQRVPEIRLVESHYMPVVLKHTLEATEQWGQIFVSADNGIQIDLLLEGTIIESSSHTLRVHMRAVDSTGRVWLDDDYLEYVGGNQFGELTLGVNDPFQSLYNRVANDLLAFRQSTISPSDANEIRTLAQIRFGQEYAPGMLGDYYSINGEGLAKLERFPALNDPIWPHIQNIQAREQMFHNLMQDRYQTFAREIGANYYDYRMTSYRELIELRNRQAEATGDLIRGTLWLGVAVATADTDSLLGTATTALSAATGTQLINQGLTALDNSTAFIDELAASFGDSAAPLAVEFEEESIMLTGSAQEQYLQWKDYLQRLYELESGNDSILEAAQ